MGYVVDVSTCKTLVILIFSTVLMSRMPSPDEHDVDQIDYPRVAALIDYFMATDELASTASTEVLLFTLALFSISGYLRIVALVKNHSKK
jgi:hypothetical protein